MKGKTNAWVFGHVPVHLGFGSSLSLCHFFHLELRNESTRQQNKLDILFITALLIQLQSLH